MVACYSGLPHNIYIAKYSNICVSQPVAVLCSNLLSREGSKEKVRNGIGIITAGQYKVQGAKKMKVLPQWSISDIKIYACVCVRVRVD